MDRFLACLLLAPPRAFRGGTFGSRPFFMAPGGCTAVEARRILAPKTEANYKAFIETGLELGTY